MREKIPYGRQDIDEEDIRAVTECLRGDWLTQGPAVAEFEARLAETTGARFAVAVSNGTAALHLACMGLGIGPGDLGITSSITFVASANCMRYVGAEVAFADVEADTGLIDLDALERQVGLLARSGRAPRLLVPVDFAGQPVDLARVRRIADKVGAKVLEDAAHSLGASYEEAGKVFKAGGCAHADAAILSFHPVKHVTTGEGGAILTNDPAVHRRLVELRSHGIHKDASRFIRGEDDPFVGPWYYEQSALGLNYRITDLQCALGVSQLRRLPAFLERRREIAERYDVALDQEPLRSCFRPLRQIPGRHNAYHLYVVQLRQKSQETLEALAARRKALFLFLRERGVLAQVHYLPVPWQPYYRELAGGQADSCPSAASYYAASISIPLFPRLHDDEIERVIALLREWTIEGQDK